MIMDHGAVSTTDVRVAHVSRRSEGRGGALLKVDAIKNADEVRVPLSDVLLACGEVAVDECEAGSIGLRQRGSS